jgi:glyoxylase-like metal-dependent hydrolase (beta-lactamase superfamily II)
MRFAFAVPAVLAVAVVAACNRQAPGIEKDYPLTKVTERVFVIQGPNEQPNKANQGFMNNPGFVLTQKGVVVIDPGSSRQVGEMLLKKIATVTKDPVIAVFNSHIHGDHWLANDAVQRAYPQAVIYAHPKMIEKTGAAGESWMNTMNRLTENAVRGTKPVAPNFALDNDETLALDGVHFHVLHTGVAHTDGDLMVEVVEEKVMFTGDNVMAHRAGRLDDGTFLGNIEACEAALRSRAVHFVPGHGEPNGRPTVAAYRDWLKAVYGLVKKYRAQGLGDFEMKDKVVAELKPYRQWAMFNDEIGKLISLAYLQAEQEEF